MKTRIYYLDNLRTFAIFLVVLVHAGIVYEQILENIWIVSDPAKSSYIGLVRMYLDLFVMYTIFFVSGYFIPLSVKGKSDMEFLKSKFKRILWPWLLAVFTLIPAYKMIFLYSRGLPQEEWYSYFHIFQRTGSDLAIFSNNPSQNWLWFLPVLFLFQVIYYYLAKSGSFKFNFSVRTGVMLAFVFAFIYSIVISSAGLTGWTHSGFLEFQRERLIPYFLVFLLGALCQKNGALSSGKNQKLYIISNVVLSLSLTVFTVVALNLFFNMIEPGRNFFFVSNFVDRSTYYLTALLSTFSFLYVMIHLFRFKFNKTNHIMSQFNQNSYSVYIIHLVVMGLLALVLVPISIPVIIKYLSLTILTFVISNLLVYAYNQIIQPKLAFRLAAVSVLIFAFLAVTHSGNKDSIPTQEIQTETSQDIPLQTDMGLHEAVIQGNLEAVQRHMAKGSDLDVRESTGGSSPLITAAVFGKSEIAKMLIDAGADLNYKNNEGSTPLITAAFFCRVEIVKALLEKGADREIRNNVGSTALDAVSAPFEEVRDIYIYFQNSLGVLGLDLDLEEVREIRPKMVDILQG